MKRICFWLAMAFLFAGGLLIAEGLYAQTVKPALPTITVPPASLLHSDDFFGFSPITSFVVPLCGWQGRQRDDGQCEITITAPPDYENFKCTVNKHKQGELYVITCTWKPKEQK
jgi:hypothetical protein